MSEHEVVVVGGGPTGMMLAAELRLAGTDVLVVERRADHELESPRSRGLHARTLEVFDQRGIADRVLAEGRPAQVQAFAGIPLDITDLPTRFNHGLALVQRHVERIMARWIDELGVRVRRGCAVTGFVAHADAVDIELSDGTTRRAGHLVGCDGGRSLVRRTAGIEFAGWDPTTSWIHAEVEMTEQPEFGLRGGGGIGPAEDGRVGVTLIEADVHHTSEPTLDDVRAALVRVDGTHYGAHRPRFVSRFTDVTRQAVRYRDGRVLLAGDAAHVHPPLGGQGLNLGIQDAVNLGWKLAQVAAAVSPVELLDTYEAERHPVGAAVLRLTMAQRALGASDERTAALRDVVGEILAMDEPRRLLGARVSGLDIRYDLGGGHPLVGRRLPDVELSVAGRRVRAFELLHDARPLLVDLGSTPGLGPGLGPWGGRFRLVAASYEGSWRLPVVGDVPAPTAVLVRPDGHVAWVGDGTDTGLRAALTRWFGA